MKLRKFKSGGVLVYVLGILAVLSLIVTEYLVEVGDEILYYSQISSVNHIRNRARSVMQITLAVLQESVISDGGLYSTKQEWSDPMKYAKVTLPDGLKANVSIQDETGRFSLNTINYDELSDLLKSLPGADSSQVDRLAPKLIQWLDQQGKSDSQSKSSKDQRESSSNSSKEEPKNKKPLGTRNLSLLHLDQLRAIPEYEAFFYHQGNPKSAFFAWQDCVTFWTQSFPNLNTAPKRVRELLVYEDSIPLDEKKYFKTKEAISLDGRFNPKNDRYTLTAEVLHVQIQLDSHGVLYRVEAYIQVPKPSQEKSSPVSFKVLALQEGLPKYTT